MATIDLNSFMLGQNSSPEARALMQHYFADAATTPLFLAATGYRLGHNYKFNLRRREHRTDTGALARVELVPVDSVDKHIDFKMVLFGQIEAPPVEVLGPNIGGTAPMDFTLAKDCFFYDGLVHDTYRILMPENASATMSAAYIHQLEELHDIVRTVGQTIGKTRQSFRPNPGWKRPDFQVLGPATLKFSNPQELAQGVVIETENLITTDDHPLYPKDEIYDLYQRRQSNKMGHRFLNRNAVCVFKGKLVLWEAPGPALEWSFFADEMRVISQE